MRKTEKSPYVTQNYQSDLTYLRLERGLRARDVARMVGYSYNYVRMVETHCTEQKYFVATNKIRDFLVRIPVVRSLTQGVGAQLRQRRMMLGWTQRQLAKQIKYSHTIVNDVENDTGKASDAVRNAMQHALAVAERSGHNPNKGTP